MLQETAGGDGNAPHTPADLRWAEAEVIRDGEGLDNDPLFTEKELQITMAAIKISQELEAQRNQDQRSRSSWGSRTQ